MNIFICNIGNRDLLLDNKPIKPARAEGEKVLGDYQKFEPKLTIPIILPAVEYILRRVKELRHITLFVTNQTPPNDNDTLYFGRIIKRMLEGEKRIGTVKLIEIPNNPSLYDEMFDFYEKKLNYKVGEWEQVFVSPTGGTPACNFALLFNAIKFFQKRCEVIYVSEKTKKALPLNCVEPLLMEFNKKTIEVLAKNYDYAAISEILKPIEEKRKLYLLSEYARLRLYFDFDSALRISEELIKITRGKLRQFSERLREELDGFLKKDIKALICELFINAKIKAIRKEYVDLLGRVFRLQEAILRYIVETELKISTDIGTSEGRTRYKEAIKKDKEIKIFLESQEVDGAKLKYDEPNTEVLLRLLNFIIDRKEVAEYTSVYKKMSNIQRLTKLRNHSIMAHGFEGISEEDIKKQRIAVKEIIEDFNSVLDDLGLKIPGPTIFENINEFILKGL